MELKAKYDPIGEVKLFGENLDVMPVTDGMMKKAREKEGESGRFTAGLIRHGLLRFKSGEVAEVSPDDVPLDVYDEIDTIVSEKYGAKKKSETPSSTSSSEASPGATPTTSQ